MVKYFGLDLLVSKYYFGRMDMKVIPFYDADDLREQAMQYLFSLVKRRLLRNSSDSIGISYFTLAKYTNQSIKPGLDAVCKILSHRDASLSTHGGAMPTPKVPGN